MPRVASPLPDLGLGALFIAILAVAVVLLVWPFVSQWRNRNTAGTGTRNRARGD